MGKILLACLLCLCSCGPRYSDFYTHFDDGTPKAKVILMPVMNGCGTTAVVTQDLTNAVREQIRGHGELYLYNETQVSNFNAQCPNIDYFGKDLSFTRYFVGADYFVALELVDHNLIDDNNLEMKMRLRVIDLRCGCPQVLMYETIDTCQRIRCAHTNCSWNCNGCDPSAAVNLDLYRCAHDRLAEKVAIRLGNAL